MRRLASPARLRTLRQSTASPSTSSFLSIASEGSVLSIGSVGSVCSIGSIGSAFSAFSIGSFASIGSTLSSASAGSVMSHASVGGVMEARANADTSQALITGGAVAGSLCLLVAAGLLAARHSG